MKRIWKLMGYIDKQKKDNDSQFITVSHKIPTVSCVVWVVAMDIDGTPIRNWEVEAVDGRVIKTKEVIPAGSKVEIYYKTFFSLLR